MGAQVFNHISGIPTGYQNGAGEALFSGQVCKLKYQPGKDYGMEEGKEERLLVASAHPRAIRWSPGTGHSWGGYPLVYTMCDDLEIVKHCTWWDRLKAPFQFAWFVWFNVKIK